MFNSQKINKNKPNPILVDLRKGVDKFGASSGYDKYLIALSFTNYDPKGHLAHARKVLDKLVNVYGSD